MREVYDNKEGAITNVNLPNPVNPGNLGDAGYMDMKCVQYESFPDTVHNSWSCDDQDDVYVIKSVSGDCSRVHYVNVEERCHGEVDNDMND